MALSTTGARGLPQSPDSVAQLAERLAPVNQKVHGSIPCRVSIFLFALVFSFPPAGVGGLVGVLLLPAPLSSIPSNPQPLSMLLYCWGLCQSVCFLPGSFFAWGWGGGFGGGVHVSV